MSKISAIHVLTQQVDSALSSATKSSPKASFVADSLATGMLVMLVMTVLQRGLGFVRGLWLCRLLDDRLLGQWSMAFDFVILVTPVMLLGIPGSLPRYAERYRVQGQLPSLARRLLGVTLMLGVTSSLLLCTQPAWFGWLVFSDSGAAGLVYAMGAAIMAFVIFSFVYQLVSALRQVRVASLMQFLQSVVFTVLGVAWLVGGGSVTGLIYAFALGTVIATLPGLLTLRAGWEGLPEPDETFDADSMWRRLMPYALALWAMNLLTNAFFLSDRYMILHGMSGGELGGAAAVGQYHSSRIIPALLMSVATMVSGVLMPYLTADWEAGRKERVRARIHQSLFAVATLFTLGSAFALSVAPWLFGQVLQGRYAAGQTLMPMAFVIAIWFALAMIAQNYLWVAERGKLVATAMGIGLVVNVLLNLLLMPRWGLQGAVVATLVANGVMLCGVWAAMARVKFDMDAGIIFLTLLPATLLGGPTVAVLCVVLTVAVSRVAQDSIREVAGLVQSKLGRA